MTWTQRQITGVWRRKPIRQILFQNQEIKAFPHTLYTSKGYVF